jgi:twitching motility protein PilT
MDITAILKTAAEHSASDIHLVAGHPPLMRAHTIITAMDYPVITPQGARQILEQVAPKNALETFEKVNDADFSYEIPGLGRYRVNAHLQRKSVAMAFRAIKSKVPPLEALNLPDVISRLTYLPRGLVLVTGDTGSGKSTTLAAMIDAMNQRYRKHIITLEDPIEYAFESNKCVIEQRELGADMPSFASGLKHILRQDPDIILVGEMRDLETTALAIPDTSS